MPSYAAGHPWTDASELAQLGVLIRELQAETLEGDLSAPFHN